MAPVTAPTPKPPPMALRRQPTGSAATHHDHDEEIVVTGVRRKAGDVLGGLSVLDSEDLAKEMRPSIGETLARQPGVSAHELRPDRLAADPARPSAATGSAC